MKNTKIYFVGFILILYFSFIFQGTKIIDSEQDIKDYKNVVPSLTTNNSLVCEWYRTWGGAYGDGGCGVSVDSSGNMYVVGWTDSFGAGGNDMVLVKYDGNGVQQWYQTWGGVYDDYGRGITVDLSGNVYITGWTWSFGAGDWDVALVKYEGNGLQQWNRTWGGVDSDLGCGVAVDSSDNVYLTGWTDNFGAGSTDMVLVKYDSSGVQQWNQTWGGGATDGSFGVAVDSPGNVYITGYTRSFGAGGNDMVLVKYDGNGIQRWNQTWGGAYGAYGEHGEGVAVDSPGNVYITGYTWSFGAGRSDVVLVKYDGNGVQQWNRTWGGVFEDLGYGAVVDSSDNVYLVGWTDSFGTGYTDMVLVKYNGNGVQQWNQTWGGGSGDHGYGVVVDSLGNVYLAGYTNGFGAGGNDMVLVKYGPYICKSEISGYDIVLVINLSWLLALISVFYTRNKIKDTR